MEDAEAAVPGPLDATHVCIGDGAFRVNVEEDFGELAALLRGEAARDGLGIADVQRFGLDNEEPKTLKEIGERLGLTRERVRQIESEAIRKMREGLEAA